MEHTTLRADAPKEVMEPLDAWLGHLLPYDRDEPGVLGPFPSRIRVMYSREKSAAWETALTPTPVGRRV
ncbi:hypothetical protein AB0H42_29480 [Nocardia sp. NPDC050799]|uniref:hypothetical protein n=1 Tax=Nocardia sp. NPDC050799 TaxID=3154842 RepID=UPI0033DE90C6